jgi:pimeloyl-ACP methyl ester carboxylesterase
MWQPQMEALHEYHCLAPDLPEHGQSAAIGPFTLDDAANRVAEFIRARTPYGRAAVAGLSLGGAVALTLMRTAPESVERVLVSGTTHGYGRLLALVNDLNVPIMRWLSPNQLARLMLVQFKIPAAYRDLLMEDLRRFTPEAAGRISHALIRVDLPESASCPTLVLAGSRETFLARRHAREIASRIQGATGRQVSGVGHVWNLEAPGLFCDVVRSWMGDRPLPPALRPWT